MALVIPAALTFAVGSVVGTVWGKSSYQLTLPPQDNTKEGTEERETAHAKKLSDPVVGHEGPNAGVLDVRRKFMLAIAGPMDHVHNCVLISDPNFDLDATIFMTIEGDLPRKVMFQKLCISTLWTDKAIAKQEMMLTRAGLATPPSQEKALVEFMNNECNFRMEHADGSFMDHLRFCHEYSHAHYKNHSPRVAFLHSIMGVGTNYFPMEKGKFFLPFLHLDICSSFSFSSPPPLDT
jgi:hypothetical protein